MTVDQFRRAYPLLLIVTPDGVMEPRPSRLISSRGRDFTGE
tara:strand:- start:24329 stop:24451 length:123 start_codon:yes stop_codon:yes gene_type:complete